MGRKNTRRRHPFDTVATGLLHGLVTAGITIIVAMALGVALLSLILDRDLPGPFGQVLAVLTLFLLFPATSQLLGLVPLWIVARRAGHRQRALGVLCCGAVMFLVTGAYCGLVGL